MLKLGVDVIRPVPTSSMATLQPSPCSAAMTRRVSVRFGGALLGGAAGAITGGAATGRAGGAVAGGIIGAAAGAAIGASMEPRRAGYYWYQDGCWLQRRDGSYMRVSRRNCY
jgi:outer membrane lipoprotein SlyB